jgi:hypothetical protein
LAFLSFLCHAEADAWGDKLPSEANRMQGWQQRFLQEHILRWMPAFILAIHTHANPLFSAMADWLWQTVAEHWQPIAVSAFTLPPPPDLLADDKTSIKDIANYLVTTPYCGAFLSRDNIGHIARTLNIPRGFGDRGQMMANLLRAAAGFEEMPALLQTLTTYFDDLLGGYANLTEIDLHLTPFITPWQERLSLTKTLLHQIAVHSHQD